MGLVMSGPGPGLSKIVEGMYQPEPDTAPGPGQWLSGILGVNIFPQLGTRGPLGRPSPGTKVGSLKLSGSQRDVVARKALLVACGIESRRRHRGLMTMVTRD